MKNMNQTIHQWLNALEKYNYEQLCSKENSDSWSMGQLYNHLISSTDYFFEQIEICMTTNDNNDQKMLDTAKIIFENGEFPDIIIKGPPSNATTPNPNSKKELIDSLKKLQDRAAFFEVQFSNAYVSGKTKHPGHHYFNASEWFNYAEMHLKHHLKQKKRIETFLGQDN